MEEFYAKPGSGNSFDFDAILGFLESKGAHLATHSTYIGEIVFFDENEDTLEYYLEIAKDSNRYLMGSFVKHQGWMLLLHVEPDKALDRALIQHLVGTYGLTVEDGEGLSTNVDGFL